MTLANLLPPADDVFWISSRLEIRQIVRDLSRKGSRVCGRVDQAEPVCVTVLDLLDSDEMVFRLDSLAALDSKALARESSLLLSSNLGRASVSFLLGRAQRITYRRETAFQAQLPDRLYKLQRRESYRMVLRPALVCRLTLPDGAGPAAADHRLSVQVLDISLGGVRIAVPKGSELPGHVGSVLYDCSMSLPGLGTLVFDLRLLYVTESAAGGGEQQIGACFVGLGRETEKRLQRYLYQLQAGRRS